MTFKLDKIKGYAIEISKLEKDLLQNKNKLLSKMYRLLLDLEVIEEEVESVMIQWSKDFGYNIQMASWGKLWRND